MVGIDQMKKSKLVCLIVCMLLVVTVFPVFGLPTETGEIQNLNSTENSDQPPAPGYAPSLPLFDTLVERPVVREIAGKTATTMDDIVISMIEQVDESIYLRYLENITDFGPRRTGTASCIAAAEYIYNQFENMGLAVRYHPWTNGGYSSNNVEATINGTDESSDEIYIICAHYDTVTGSPGADDDGSGTVAVLLAAYVMSQYQFNHTVKFVTFSGEEQGLLGSQIYAQQAKAQGWNIMGVLNCDMISYAITTADGNNLKVYVNSASTWLYTYTVNINSKYNSHIKLTLHNAGSASNSDHYYFWVNGYPAIFYFEYQMTPYYHSPQDTIDNINATYAVKNVRLALATLAELSEASYPSSPPSQPTKPSGESFGIWHQEYSYTSSSTDPEGDQISYLFDWDDGSNSGWLGPYPSGTTATASHTWTELGTYSVTVKARDVWGATSPISDPLLVTITDNTPPNTPTITGPTSIKPFVSYTYTFNGTDDQDQDLLYEIDWGDGNGAAGVGPYQSGEEFTMTHTWKKRGTFVIRTRTTDTAGARSDWATIEIAAPFEYRFSLHALIEQLFEMFPRMFPMLRHLMAY
jgi:hypothetical protein